MFHQSNNITRIWYHKILFNVTFVCSFFRPHLQHMEVPRLGVKSELQLLAYSTATATVESEPHLQPTPQLMATLDPWPTEWSQGSNPHPYGSSSTMLLLMFLSPELGHMATPNCKRGHFGRPCAQAKPQRPRPCAQRGHGYWPSIIRICTSAA